MGFLLCTLGYAAEQFGGSSVATLVSNWLSMHTLKEAANTASLIVPKLKAELKPEVSSGVVVPFQKVA